MYTCPAKAKVKVKARPTRTIVLISILLAFLLLPDPTQANTHKHIFQPATLPSSPFPNTTTTTPIITLTPSIPYSTSNPTSYFRLVSLSPHQTYELKVCWSASTPANPHISIYASSDTDSNDIWAKVHIQPEGVFVKGGGSGDIPVTVMIDRVWFGVLPASVMGSLGWVLAALGAASIVGGWLQRELESV